MKKENDEKKGMLVFGVVIGIIKEIMVISDS